MPGKLCAAYWEDLIERAKKFFERKNFQIAQKILSIKYRVLNIITVMRKILEQNYNLTVRRDTHGRVYMKT